MKTVLTVISMVWMSIIFMMISVSMMFSMMIPMMIPVISTLKMRSLVEWKLIDQGAAFPLPLIIIWGDIIVSIAYKVISKTYISKYKSNCVLNVAKNKAIIIDIEHYNIRKNTLPAPEHRWYCVIENKMMQIYKKQKM